LTIIVVRRLGAIDLGLESGQLGFEKGQRLLGFGRAPFDILAKIGIHDVVENYANLSRIPSDQAHFEETRFFPAFLDGEAPAQVFHGGFGRELRQPELCSWPRLELRDENRIALTAGPRPGLALEHHLIFPVKDLEATAVASDQRQPLVQRRRRNLERIDLNAVTAPGKTRQTQPRRTRLVAVVATGNRAANQGQRAGNGNDVQLELVDHPPKNHP
jgi:hypothetical protein